MESKHQPRARASCWAGGPWDNNCARQPIACWPDIVVEDSDTLLVTTMVDQFLLFTAFLCLVLCADAIRVSTASIFGISTLMLPQGFA